MPVKTDLTNDAAVRDGLSLARHATANFNRVLLHLRPDDFGGSTRISEVNRAELIARLSYQARRMATLCESLRTQTPAIPLLESATQDEIRYGATMPVQALRNLFQHSAVHLNVEWRDLPAEAWFHPLKLDYGSDRSTMVELVRYRATELWESAAALDTGQTEQSIPEPLRQYRRILTGGWGPRLL